MTEVITEAPCPDWSGQVVHDGHDWTAPVDGPAHCPGWPPAPPEPSTAAEHDGWPLVHSHVGEQQPHVHTAETFAMHRRPIVGERVYARLPEPEPGPATWHEGPYAAASSLRQWAELLSTWTPSTTGREQLARDLRGAASVLDGVTR